MSFWGPVVGGLLQGGSGLVGGLLGQAGQAGANAQMFQNAEMLFNQQQTQNWSMLNAQQDFAREMSGTAWVRGVQDMKNAGINPILAAGMGGASSPVSSGSSASIGNPQLGNPGASMAQGVASAGQAASTIAGIKATLAQADKDQSAKSLNEATEQNQKAQAVVNDVVKDRVKQETVTSATQAAANAAAAENSKAQAAAAGSTAALNYAKTVTEGHEANSAFQRSRIAQREADDRINFGGGTYGDLASAATRGAATATRGAADLGQSVWGAYSDYIGKPFANMVDKAVGVLTGKPTK